MAHILMRIAQVISQFSICECIQNHKICKKKIMATTKISMNMVDMLTHGVGIMQLVRDTKW